MKYLLLVSHGGFSEGLKSTLSMFAGDAIDSVIAVGLKKDESADDFGKRFTELLKKYPDDSEFIVLADIIGGSPLTTVCNILNAEGKLTNSMVLGGMNFPMALTTLMSKDSMDIPSLKKAVLSEASSAMKEFKIQSDDSSDDDEI
jgi:Phosphotransferase system, mannose/fructose-specific component IIA